MAPEDVGKRSGVVAGLAAAAVAATVAAVLSGDLPVSEQAIRPAPVGLWFTEAAFLAAALVGALLLRTRHRELGVAALAAAGLLAVPGVLIGVADLGQILPFASESAYLMRHVLVVVAAVVAWQGRDREVWSWGHVPGWVFTVAAVAAALGQLLPTAGWTGAGQGVAWWQPVSLGTVHATVPLSVVVLLVVAGRAPSALRGVMVLVAAVPALLGVLDDLVEMQSQAPYQITPVGWLAAAGWITLLVAGARATRPAHDEPGRPVSGPGVRRGS